uniref:Vomeronasal type-1 receptor n=1 Tax=Nannospalax galili TaxID=1026970 RepID=A0A4Y1N582_NANGA|nr:vomeronasal type 1 receptor 12 [Nannospalax galili]AWV49812.1 vomeronasal type 1 receptor 12 [Nannospalax galili]AWV49813.1 vomeronasal type 1 receptor 12 [Nannospalax galili]AWV49814.1 vomeronasal type 1 receptor 12 [Nannospalax galili]AWV49816.1 vomeronasal type 1 receptor 12 [Nannospalax galili]
MCSATVDVRIIFLTQTVIGTIGNSSLLCLYIFTLFTGHHLRPIDLISSQLVLANFVVLFSKYIPQIMAIWGWNYFLDDMRCKLIFYFYRAGTEMSFSTVCLFNGFQAIKLNPRICKWIEIKIRSIKFIGCCCLLSWFLHLSVNSFLPFVVNGPVYEKNLSVESNHVSCSWAKPAMHISFSTILYFSPDMMSLIFMIWASGMVILVIHRHKQRVQHIHSSSLSSSASYEARATLRILILVSFFTAFYSVYIILKIWMTLAKNCCEWIANSSVLLLSCFPVFSPYVLLISDTRVSQVCFACRRRNKALP